MWMSFNLFFMFSNFFYCLGLHDETCVALAPIILEIGFLFIKLWLLKVCVCLFLN